MVMVEFETKKPDVRLCEELTRLIEKDFEDNRAAFSAQSIIDVLDPNRVTQEKELSRFMSYTTGPFEEPPSDEQRHIYNIVNKSLSPRHSEERSTPGVTVYTTDLPKVTIVCRENYADKPGVRIVNLEIHREADIEP